MPISSITYSKDKISFYFAFLISLSMASTFESNSFFVNKLAETSCFKENKTAARVSFMIYSCNVFAGCWLTAKLPFMMHVWTTSSYCYISDLIAYNHSESSFPTYLCEETVIVDEFKHFGKLICKLLWVINDETRIVCVVVTLLGFGQCRNWNNFARIRHLTFINHFNFYK